MPAENEFDQEMRHLLFDLRVEPQPSDWAAIDARLRPGRRRRMVWWWIPLVAAVAGTALWMRNEPPAAARSTMPAASQAPAANTGEPTPGVAETTLPQPGKDQASRVAAQEATAFAHPQANQEGSNQRADGRQHQALTSAQTLQPFTPGQAGITQSLVAAPPEKPGSVQPLNTTAGSQPGAASKTGYAVPAAALDTPVQQGNTTSLKSISADSSEPQPMIVAPKTPGAADTTVPATMPNSRPKTRRWQWLVYAGAGQSGVNDGLSWGKSMEIADITASPGGSRTYTNLLTQPGGHFAAGLTLQQTLGRSFRWQVGLGAGSYGWTLKANTYLDTMIGQRSQTLVTATSNQSIRLLTLDIPMHAYLRLAGRRQQSLWWGLGVQHQFVLSLKDKYTRQAVVAGGTFSTTQDQQSLTSSVATYVPMLQTHLLWQHSLGGLRGQLRPLIGFSPVSLKLSAVAPSNLWAWQLQYQVYLQKK